MIIAIDGPLGVGKSSVAKEVAKRLGFTYIDTGAMYRAFALKTLKEGININDINSVINLLKNTDIQLSYENGELKVYLDGEDITDKIRDEKVSKRASEVAAIKEVRDFMVDLQRKYGKSYKNIVIEGRDTGTVIFPNADLKIFLTAPVEVRIQRRYKQLLEKGFKVNYDEFVKGFLEREERDNTRKINPLRPAEDSIIIDSGNMSFEDVVEKIINLAKERMKKEKN